MARGLGRVGADAAGGVILAGCNSVFINGLPAARLMSPVAGHGKDRHAGPVMITSEPSIVVENIPVCCMGNIASCGHMLLPGSPDVVIG